jgi:hypothetical protein
MSEITVNQEKYRDMQRNLVIANRALQIANVEYDALQQDYDRLRREHDDLQRDYRRMLASRVVSA